MIGERLRELRTAKGMTQKEVAKFVNVAQSTYTLYEGDKREPPFETLCALADLFGTTCDYLLRGIETKNITLANELGLCNDAINVLIKTASAVGEDGHSYKMSFDYEFMHGIDLLISTNAGRTIVQKIYRYLNFNVGGEGILIDMPCNRTETYSPREEISIDEEGRTIRYTTFENMGSILFLSETDSDITWSSLQITADDLIASLATQINNELKNWRDKIKDGKKD